MTQRRRLARFGRAGLLAAATLGSPLAWAQDKGIVVIDLPVPFHTAEQIRAWHKAGVEEVAKVKVWLKSASRTIALVDYQEGEIQDLAGAHPRFVLGPCAAQQGGQKDLADVPVDLRVIVHIEPRQGQVPLSQKRLFRAEISLSTDGYAQFKEMVETQGALLYAPGTTMERGDYHLVCKPLGISPETFEASRAGGGETKGSAGAAGTR